MRLVYGTVTKVERVKHTNRYFATVTIENDTEPSDNKEIIIELNHKREFQLRQPVLVSYANDRIIVQNQHGEVQRVFPRW